MNKFANTVLRFIPKYAKVILYNENDQVIHEQKMEA